LIDEHCDVVRDALVGIVGSVAAEPHPVVHAIVEPVIEIATGHPSTPSDLQPLIEIELIDGNDDEAAAMTMKVMSCCQNAGRSLFWSASKKSAFQ
jgi:hypothetical protein